jgi:hypothetical protein
MSMEQNTNDDWITAVLAKLEHGVSLVRDTATNRVIKVMRSVMYGVMAAIIGVFAFILLAVMAVRLLFVGTGHRAWLAHGITGLVFLIAGVVLLRLRHANVEV